MKPYDILEAIGEVDDRCIQKATKKKHPLKAVGIAAAVAACLLLCLVPLTQPLFHTPTPSPSQDNTAADTYWVDNRERNETPLISADSAIVWPWEYLTTPERYRQTAYNGIDYTIKGGAVPALHIGAKLADATATGHDEITGTTHSTACTLYAIHNVDTARVIAVRYDGDETYYPAACAEYTPPATLGELINALNLTQTCPFVGFYDRPDDVAFQYYGLSADDSETLWAIFASCGDAKIEARDFRSEGQRVMSFPLFSQTLGVSNLSWSVDSDGYLRTNIERYGYVFYIGTETVETIVSTARARGVEDTPKTTQRLYGVVTEIGEDYIKIDDTSLMKDPRDGIEFTVTADDITIRRYILHDVLEVGDLVAVEHSGILASEPTVVATAHAIHEAILTDSGDVLIPE